MSGLIFDAYNREWSSDGKPIETEIATTRDGMDVTQLYAGELGFPQDTLLQEKGGYDYLAYEKVLQDDQCQSTFQQRRKAVVSCDWEVTPGGERPIDREASDFIQEQLDHIGFDRVTDMMLYGVWYGFAIAELMWKQEGPRVVLDCVKVRNRRRFLFNKDGRPRLKTFGHPRGTVLPDKKFWTFSTGADHDDDPYGRGIASWCWWPVYFKRAGIRYWMVFLEKLAQPTVVGKYQPGTPAPEQNRLLRVVKSIMVDSGVIHPDTMDLSLLEAARSASPDYKAMTSLMNSAVSKVVLSQTMTTDDGSSLSQSETHMEVRQDVVKADADLVCASFRDQVIRWLIEWNFPGAALPNLRRVLEEPEDRANEVEVDKGLYEIGYEPTEERIEEVYGQGYRPRVLAVAPPSGPEADPADLAEGDDKTPLEVIGDQLDLDIAESVGEWVDAIESMVKRSSNLGEVKGKLGVMFAEMDEKHLAEAFRRASALAHLVGASEVVDGG